MLAIELRKPFMCEELCKRGDRLKVMGWIRLGAIEEFDNFHSPGVPWSEHGGDPYNEHGHVATVSNFFEPEGQSTTYYSRLSGTKKKVCWSTGYVLNAYIAACKPRSQSHSPLTRACMTPARPYS